MIEISNNYDSFVALWRRLERTRQLFGMQYRRFCIRRVLVSWFGAEATDDLPSASHLPLGHQQASLHGSRSLDDFIWEICFNTIVDDRQYYGLDELPAPSLHPRASREFLRAVVAVRLGIGMRKVNLKALDRAYTEAFPHSTPININKKRHKPP